MISKVRFLRISISSVLIAASWLTPIGAAAQDLVPVSSITGGSSVFVFRNTTRAPRRFVAAAKPARTKVQRMETVAKIKKQYDTIAKTNPNREYSKIVDPTKVPPGAEKTMPAAQVSKLFAGVGEYYLQKGDYNQSFDFFRDAIRLDDKNNTAKGGFSDALATQGNEMLVKDQVATAKGVFLEAIKYNPNNSAAYFGLGEAFADLNETAEAIANYEKALDKDKALTEIYVPLGILYYQAGDIAKADDLLTKALATSSESSETQFFLGLVRLSQNNQTAALTAFQKAKTLDPTNADAFFHSADSLSKAKKYAEAIPDYLKAIELKPTNYDAQQGLADAYLELGKFKEAIAAYNAAKKLKSDDWELYYGLAEAYRQTGESYEEAVSAYRLTALFYSQTTDVDKNKLADFYSRMGFMIGLQCEANARKNIGCDWAPAIKSLKNAAETSGSPVDYTNLGWAYFRAAHPDAEAKRMDVAKPNLDLAKAALEKAVAGGGPALDYSLQNLAAVEIDLGDNKGAKEALAKLIDKRPDNSYAKYALGVAYFKENDLPNAEKWFRSALDKEPNNGDYLMALGNTLVGRKDGKGLVKVIEKLRTIDPNAAEILETKRKVLRL